MIFTDLNNVRYASAFSVMIQEHFNLLSSSSHPSLDYGCYTCGQIRMMDRAGVLDGIVVGGFWDCDLREYDRETDTWWNFSDNCVNSFWMQEHVYGKPVGV